MGCSFLAYSVKIGAGDALAVKLPDGRLFDMAADVQVSGYGLAYELAPGTVKFVAEAIGFFKEFGWQSEQEARHTRCPFVCAYLLYLCFAVLHVVPSLGCSRFLGTQFA